jgi:glycosyltransferase involved in cell wall biosynthesis
LIIPCYNEAKNLPLLFERCSKIRSSSDIEIVFVDNGSTDGSGQIMKDLSSHNGAFQVVTVSPNKGYGNGVLAGLRSAKGEILSWTHADLQTDPQDILVGLEVFESSQSKNIFVKGRRYGRPFSDLIFTLGMSLFETFLLRKVLFDINAQPNMFSREFFEKWESPPLDFSLDLFAYFCAKKQGLEIHRFPVKFGERAHGVSHWNIDWMSKWRFIKRTIEFSVQLKKRG